MKPITSIPALRKAIKNGQTEFGIALNGGAYSRKTITILPRLRFRVVNGIDDTIQRLTARELSSKSMIGQAIKLGALYPL